MNILVAFGHQYCHAEQAAYMVIASCMPVNEQIVSQLVNAVDKLSVVRIFARLLNTICRSHLAQSQR